MRFCKIDRICQSLILCRSLLYTHADPPQARLHQAGKLKPRERHHRHLSRAFVFAWTVQHGDRRNQSRQIHPDRDLNPRHFRLHLARACRPEWSRAISDLGPEVAKRVDERLDLDVGHDWK